MTGAFSSPTTIHNVRPWGGAPSDIDISDGVITSITPAAAAIPDGAFDGRGLLAIPGIINTHAHLDKSWWGLPWQSYGGEGTTDGRIRHERARRDELGFPSVTTTANVLAEFVKHGTTAIRTHVDVDLGVELRGIEAVREAAAAYDGALGLEIVSFPQDGVLRRPGVMELLERAAAAGVEHIGGIDPATIDRDPVGQLDGLFRIAEKHGCGIDIHLHDAAELGAFQLELIIDRTRKTGLTGKVNIAHGFAIAQIDAGRRDDLLAQFAELDITFTTVAPLRLPQLPLKEFDAVGVNFGFGTDGIRDLWSPYGTGDTMGIAWQYARSSSIVRDEDLTRIIQIATSGSARFVGRDVHDLVVGSHADIVLVDSENPMDVLVRQLPREVVIASGKLLYQR